MKVESNLKSQLLVIFIGIILFIPYLGNVHLFDWDEINFAEAAREMIVTGDYLNVRIDFEPFHEKPPLFIWLQVISMKIFGINEFAARFPNAIIGIITLLVIFNIGKKLFDFKFGLFWVLTFIGSVLPHFYFKTAIIDPFFNLLMFTGIYFLYKFFLESNQKKYLILASVMVALAVVTKGPVGYLLPFLTLAAFLVIKRKSVKLKFLDFILFTIISFIPAILWYIYIFTSINDGLITEFINYQIRLLTTGDAGHEGPFYYHFAVLLIGCFPASVLILRSFRNQEQNDYSQNSFRIWNIILLSVVLIVFSLVKTKIVHYSSLAFFPITYLAALTIYNVSTGKIKWKLSSSIFLGSIGLIFSLALFWFPIVLMNIGLFIPKIDDEFTREVLKTSVTWSGIEWIIGVIYFLGLLISLIFTAYEKFIRGFIILFATSAISVFLILPMLAPKIEAYTQNAPVEFFKSIAQKDVYIATIGYKSYAPYFYGQKRYDNSKLAKNMSGEEFEKFLLTGQIDKDAYFSAKLNTGKHLLQEYSDIQLIKIKNGFVFMKRTAKN